MVVRVAVVAGAAAMDLMVGVQHLPLWDTTSFAVTYLEQPGGSAANLAVGLARLGWGVRFLGRVGDDEAGRVLVRAFADEGVDTRYVLVGRGRSARALVLVGPEGERAVVCLGGEGPLRDGDPVPAAAFTGSEMVCLAEAEPDAALRMVEAAVAAGARLVLTSTWCITPECLGKAALVILSRGEAEKVTGEGDPPVAAQCLREQGAQMVVVTAGADGCVVAWAHQCLWVAGFPGVAVDSTGAGDAFAAAFLTVLAERGDPAEAAFWGNAAGAWSVRRWGARAGLPRRPELEGFVAQLGREQRCIG